VNLHPALIFIYGLLAIAPLLWWFARWQPTQNDQRRQRERFNERIVIADCAGVIEYVNPRYTHITGYSNAEAVGRIAELMNSEDLTDTNNLNMQEAMQLGSSWETFMVSSRKSGERFWQQVTASPILDDLGALSHIVLNIEDISVRDNLVFEKHNEGPFITFEMEVIDDNHIKDILGFVSNIKPIMVVSNDGD